ncbi:MAG: helix-turn-helix domain-containing protein [Bacillota bacterium]
MLLVRYERLKRGWSLRHVATLIGIAHPDLSKIERGSYRVFPGWRKKLADLYGIDEQRLFEDSN